MKTQEKDKMEQIKNLKGQEQSITKTVSMDANTTMNIPLSLFLMEWTL